MGGRYQIRCDLVMVILVCITAFAINNPSGAEPAWSDEVTVIMPPDSLSPAAPTGLTAESGTLTLVVNLDWNDNTEDDIDYYSVYRSITSGSSYSLIGTTDASSYEDLNVSLGVQYYYRVTATDLSGNPESAPSNEAQTTVVCYEMYTIDDSDPEVTYNGSWNVQNGWPGRFNETLHESETAGAEMIYTFHGNGIELHAEDASPWGGCADIYIDDVFQEQICFIGEHPPYGIVKFAITGLSTGWHTLKMVVVGDGWCYVDYLSVMVMCVSECPDKVPAAPSDLVVTVGDPCIFLLDWVDNSDNNCDDASGFTVERKTEGGDYEVVGDVLTGTTFEDTVDYVTTYTYRVTAYNALGSSSPSNELMVTSSEPPTPEPPANLQAVTDTGQITLSWDQPMPSCPAPEVLYYIIHRSTTQGGPYVPMAVVFGGMNVTDYNVYDGTTYYYRITATDTWPSTSVLSDQIEATSGDQPPAPVTGLTAVSGNGYIYVDWDDHPESDVNRYSLSRVMCVPGGTCTYPLALGEISVSEYTDSQDMMVGNTYYYTVVALDDADHASPGVETSVIYDPSPPDLQAPTNLAWTYHNPCYTPTAEINLTWTDNSTGEQGYLVERRSLSGSFEAIASLGPDTDSYADPNPTEDDTGNYTYRIGVHDEPLDTVLYSDSVSVPPYVLPPGLVVSLTATVVAPTEVELVWDDNMGVGQWYRIERALEWGPFVEIATIDTGETTYTDTGLQPASNYSYYVYAGSDECGDIVRSNHASATTNPIIPVDEWVDDADSAIIYGGTWSAQSGWSDRYEQTLHESSDAAAMAELTFTGFKIELIADKQQWGGTIDVYIDDVLMLEDVSFYDSVGQLYQQVIFTIDGLTSTEHTVRIEKSGGDWIYLDAFVYSHY